jgi:arsenate reductase (thioredoxin)
MHRVLFLCNGNSARSQMAEAIVNARMPGWRALSAGVHPAPEVNPLALQVLQEIGIRHDSKPRSVEQYRGWDFDLVVTLCDEAESDCPVWLGQGRRVHESFRDPAKAEGTEQERLTVFRQVRDQLLEKMPALLKQHSVLASS